MLLSPVVGLLVIIILILTHYISVDGTASGGVLITIMGWAVPPLFGVAGGSGIGDGGKGGNSEVRIDY